jgi:hypothetical protein
MSYLRCNLFRLVEHFDRLLLKLIDIVNDFGINTLLRQEAIKAILQAQSEATQGE